MKSKKSELWLNIIFVLQVLKIVLSNGILFVRYGMEGMSTNDYM